MGAGGKMGCRITDQVKDDPRYDVRYVEPAQEGRDRLRERGVSATDQAEALEGTDVVILAVPDDSLGEITDEVVPAIDSGSMVVLLDPAAAYADALHDREDVTYFVTHPCHPGLFGEHRPEEYAEDWFGGQGMAEQHIVCALHQGPEADYERGEELAQAIYAPVGRTHRLTTEQMALLEPALAETLAATLIDTIHEGMEEIVDAGVPEQAARDFLMGHMRIEIAIIFGMADFPFSDAAQRKIEEARGELLQEDWKEVLTVERTRESVRDIADM
jgi:ketol-acid reductoisomerase